jgi:hypothetical protein
MGTFTVGSVSPPVYGNSSSMFALAQQLIVDTEQFAQQLSDINFVAPVINPSFPTIAAAPTIQTATQPNLQTVTWSVPQQPAPFNGTLNINNLIPGPFSGLQPTLTFPAPPAPFSATPPPSPPVNLNFTYPNPTVALPTPPSLMGLDTINFNPLNIPQFNVTVPTLQVSPPNIIPYVEGPAYVSSLLTQLQADLLNALQEGTWTGLPGPIEDNLWGRAAEREYRQTANALDELERMETLGYAFPPGVYIDARVRMQTELANTMAGLSRDIAWKQADLTLQNINRARELSVSLEGKFIDYTNQVNQRAFESAKYITEAAVQLYNTSVQAYEAELKGYEVQAQVYDTQLKGIQAQIAQLEAQIRFEQTKAEINTALVQQYKTEVDASLAIVQIYDLQIKIIQTQAEVQKLIVDIFNAQIQAYVGQIQAFTAQVEAYKAGIQAQGEIENVYKTQVDAYVATVQAGVSEADALVKQYEGQIDAYKAQIQGYTASLQAMVEQARAASLYNEAAAQVFSAEAQAVSSYNGTITAQWQAVINEQLQITQIGVSAAEANGKLYEASAQLAEDAAKVGAQVNAQLGAAALGAIHWASTSNWSTSSSAAIQSTTSTITETISSVSA